MNSLPLPLPAVNPTAFLPTVSPPDASDVVVLKSNGLFDLIEQEDWRLNTAAADLYRYRVRNADGQTLGVMDSLFVATELYSTSPTNTSRSPTLLTTTAAIGTPNNWRPASTAVNT